MTDRTFGGLTLSELKELRRNSADGAKFYMALLDASPDFFLLADEVEQLEAVIEKLVSHWKPLPGKLKRKAKAGQFSIRSGIRFPTPSSRRFSLPANPLPIASPCRPA